MSQPDAQPPGTPSGARRVVLHVGEPKTGTTFLQQVMWSNRSSLAAAGVMLPGARPSHHWRAAQDLREVVQRPNDPIGPHAGSWDRLVRQAVEAPHTAVISHELFSGVNERQAGRAIRSLGSADVHVVLSVRDIASLLPAEWQETVKHRNGREWPSWLGDVIDREADSDDRRQWWFWRVHDTKEILRIWGAHLPPENVHVLTMPPRALGERVLWERFATVLDVDPGIADVSLARANASLGLAEVEFIRQVNLQLPDTLPDWFYMHNVKDVLAHKALADRRSTARLKLPSSRDAWAAEYANDLADWLRASPYDLVGDPAELLPKPDPSERPDQPDAPAQQQLDAAVEAVVALLVELGAARGIPRPGEQPKAAAPEVSHASPLKRALISASERNQSLHHLRRQYWHLRNTLRTVRADQQARREVP